MMNDDKVKLWEAINAYVVACGGDPSRHVYGNTPRMDAVSEVEVERAVEEIATPGGVWTGRNGEPVSLGSVPFTPLLNACIEIARATSRGVVAGASDFGAIVREALDNLPLDEFVAEFERFDGVLEIGDLTTRDNSLDLGLLLFYPFLIRWQVMLKLYDAERRCPKRGFPFHKKWI